MEEILARESSHNLFGRNVLSPGEHNTLILLLVSVLIFWLAKIVFQVVETKRIQGLLESQGVSKFLAPHAYMTLAANFTRYTASIYLRESSLFISSNHL